MQTTQAQDIQKVAEIEVLCNLRAFGALNMLVLFTMSCEDRHFW